ncbi:MAG: TraR/DksA family transcriptional regulator, partial [Pseudomonadota bacterium]|nr:TraR/DksA family transcriptional regulator [Pseudomonadota bacterium]
ALGRIKEDSFGWCDDSGEPIGLKRLLISPTTKYCIEAQERHEQIDKHQRQA